MYRLTFMSQSLTFLFFPSCPVVHMHCVLLFTLWSDAFLWCWCPALGWRCCVITEHSWLPALERGDHGLLGAVAALPQSLAPPDPRFSLLLPVIWHFQGAGQTNLSLGGIVYYVSLLFLGENAFFLEFLFCSSVTLGAGSLGVI